MSEPSSLSRWKEFRYRLEWAICAAIAWGIPRLPRRSCVTLSVLLGHLAFRLDRKGRAVALSNLATIFGDRFSEERRKEIALRSYQNFTRTMIDLFWSPRLTPENWRDYILPAGEVEALVRNAALPEKERQGAVYLCVHWGNFEWSSLACGFLGAKTLIVAETFKNRHLNDLFKQPREVAGHTIIPQEYSMIRLLKVVKRHGFAGMLADLTLRPDQAATIVYTFGRPISTTALHGVLAERGGAIIVPVHGESLPDGRCRVTLDLPLAIPEGATAAEIAQLCWDRFEPVIRQRPELWMWAYKHWRYRPRAASPDDYPFYANVSSKFERLLKNDAKTKRQR